MRVRCQMEAISPWHCEEHVLCYSVWSNELGAAEAPILHFAP